MPIKKKPELEKVQPIWNRFLDSQKDALKETLTELEVSALYTCIEDCYESFHEIYFNLIPGLQVASKQKNYDKMQTYVLDIYWAFDHIKNHIIDSDKGFLELSKHLEKKEMGK